MQIFFFIPAIKINFYLKKFKKFFSGRKILIAKEMTKIHEATWRGYCSEILAELKKNGVKKDQFSRGELVVIIDLSNQKKISVLNKEFEFWLKTLKPHLKSSVLAKILSEKFGKNRREVYAEFLKH